MSGYPVTTARAEQVLSAAPLILDSGPTSLKAMFDRSPQHTALAYLASAFVREQGQFSHSQHQIIELNGNLAAIGSCWTSPRSRAFQQATLDSLTGYYGTALTMDVIAHSQLIAEVIPTPSIDELGVGHIAVNPSYFRQGLATCLLEHYVQLAEKMDKKALVLDVASSNFVAQSLYQKFGFEFCGESLPGEVAQRAGVLAHHHMRLSL